MEGRYKIDWRIAVAADYTVEIRSMCQPIHIEDLTNPNGHHDCERHQISGAVACGFRQQEATKLK